MDAMNSTLNLKINPLNKIIGLSIVLSMGFLLVILAGIYGNWFPIIIGLVFAVAHLPMAITKAVSSSSDYDFNFDALATASGNGLLEAGYWTSAFLLTSGLALPILLHHSLILTKTAMVLSIVGGSLIFGTIFAFSLFFDEEDTDEAADIGGGII